MAAGELKVGELKSTLAANYLQLKENLREKTLVQRQQRVKRISVTLAGFAIITAALYTVLVLNGAKGIELPISSICWLASILYLALYFILRAKSSLQRVDIASRVFVACTLIAVSVSHLTIGSLNGAVIASYVIIPTVAGVCGLRTREVVISAILAFIVMSAVFMTQEVFKVYTLPNSYNAILNYFDWVIVFGIIALGTVTFRHWLSKANSEAQAQNDQLVKLLELLNSTTEFGAVLSRELSGVTSELNSTSQQHASSTQEQVAAVTEVTTSLEELTETANQIAGSAASAASAATQAVEQASEVKNASLLAQTASEQGQQAVEQTVASVERVRNRIELLGQRLLHLTEQTRKVGTIIDIIDEIADETHLLALNASIEAAGGTYNGGETNQNLARSSRGERFGIIAQEVKNLSDRSRESTEEVRQAITEMQGAVAAAVLVAEEGKKESAAALSRSQIAGVVIEKLSQVISNSAGQAEQILEAVEEVRVRCDEISVATGQQRSANQQILATMRSVAQVSQESAGAVSQLSLTVSKVNQQVDQLNTVLDRSNQSVQLMAA